MLTIITPCCRQGNLPHLFNSINFDKIHKWIIVYDTSNERNYSKLYEEHPKIQEYFCSGGISGNPQRNFALDIVEDGFIYFLDDDNIIHPNFWAVVEQLDDNHFFTFDQIGNDYCKYHYGSDILEGNRVELFYIDTAMYILHKKFINDIRWKNELYNADGHFITDIYNNHKSSHKYINIVASYYNHLRR
jgi:hypothetical protein